MTWYTYDLGPIDFAWEHLKTVDETAMKLGAMSASARVQGMEDSDLDVSVEDFLENWELARGAIAGEKLRRDPVVFWVPVEDRFEYGFAMKIDNNGTTYVVSPVELPHLGEASQR